MARQPLRRRHPSPMVLQTTLTARPYHHHPSDCRGLPRERQGGTGGFGDVDGVGGRERSWLSFGLPFPRESLLCGTRLWDQQSEFSPSPLRPRDCPRLSWYGNSNHLVARVDRKGFRQFRYSIWIRQPTAIKHHATDHLFR
jgi:hypothetical protein